MLKVSSRLLPLLGFMLIGLVFWRGLSLNPHKLPFVQAGKPLPSFSLPALGEGGRVVSEQWIGQPALINVWASWCEVCADEQAFLMKLADSGVRIYALNYKDKTSDALAWLNRWGNPYQAVAVDKKGKLAMELGVYGTPETFLLDKYGRLVYRHTGELTQAVWESAFLPRL